MKTRLAIPVIALLIWVFPWLTAGSSPGDSSCVKCHTDAKIMKSLAKVPVVSGEEGEG